MCTIETTAKGYSIPENAVVVGLCAGRHDMPVSDFIFPQVVDPTDFRGMEFVVGDFIKSRVGIHEETQSDTGGEFEVMFGDRPLVVYVTGLTACVVAVVKVCMFYGVDLTLMHYDRASGGYLPQVVI